MDHTSPSDSNSTQWYYTIIQNPGASSEQIVGFIDPDTNDKFLPAFKSKEAAKTCFKKMPKDLFAGDYDAQAIIEEDLVSIAGQAGHNVFLLDEKGTILNHLNP